MTMSDDGGAGRDPRVRLAAERTLLAWIRTGLAMMGFGFVVARFGLFLREVAAVERLPDRSIGLSLWLGTALVALGVGANVLAALEHRRFLRRYERGDPDEVPRFSLGLAAAVLLAAVGVGMIGYLVSL
jgi:putative membrane protein